MSKKIEIEIGIVEKELQQQIKQYHANAVKRSLDALFEPRRWYTGGEVHVTEAIAGSMIKQMVEEAVSKELVIREAHLQEQVKKAFDLALEKAIEKAAAHAANKIVFNSPAVRTRAQN